MLIKDNLRSVIPQIGKAVYNGQIYEIVIGEDYLTLDKISNLIAGSTNINVMLCDDRNVYIAANTGVVYKVDKNSLISTGIYYLYTSGGSVIGMCQDAEYLYIGGYSVTAKNVRKIRKSDMSLIASGDVVTDNICNVKCDDNFVYYTSGNYVYKVNKSNLSYVGRSPNLTNVLTALFIDNGYIYTGGNKKTVTKLDINTLAYVSESPTIEQIYDIHIKNNMIYTGSFTQFIHKLNISNLSIIQSISHGNLVRTLDSDDKYLYAGGNSAYGVKKYSLSDFVAVDQIIPNPLVEITSLTLNNGYLYYGGADCKIYKNIAMPKIVGARRIV